MTTLEGSVSDTAYLVCESRARGVEISRDVYAPQWIAPEQRESVAELWEEFSREVYPHDDVEVSIRCRHWLERILGFAERASEPVFVNVGAGLTSYPYLLPHPVPTVELDRVPVVAYKEARIGELERQGVLPEREVTLHAVDLARSGGLEELGHILREACAGRCSFVLCEGLLYYLERSAVDALVATIRDVQEEGSVLGVDFWSPAVAESPVFRRMQAFFADRFGIETRDYTFLDEVWARSLAGYEAIELTDVVEQEGHYADTHLLDDPDAILLETYATLECR